MSDESAPAAPANEAGPGLAEREGNQANAASIEDEPVPKLPRGKGITLTRGALTRIGFTAIALVAVLVLQKPCSRAAGQFVTAFGEEPGAPAAPAVAPAPVPTQYEVLTPSMTDDELRAAIGRAEARARQAREAPAPAPAPSPAPPPVPAVPSQP